MINFIKKWKMTELEHYFEQFRENVIGINQTFNTPFGEQIIHYADWTASGRLYSEIETNLLQNFYPFVGNTHTETSVTGSGMTIAYHKAQHIIKDHVHANEDDVLISVGSGMTGAINKFQRILGLKVHEKFKDQFSLTENDRPIVFVTHMEHHSNQTSWIETICDVEVIGATSEGLVDLVDFKRLIKKYENRPIKIAAVTSASNVTGIITPYHEIAEIIHENNGWCFVDFACSAPYIDIDMHPANENQKLDAIFFSPHKFLGGPGTSGVVVFDKKLYTNKVPDHPGGGTVEWTNPWGGHEYVKDIEAREDGGTPGFLQTIRTALSVQLKEKMTVEKMLKREEELLEKIFDELLPIENIHILADNIQHRLGVISFYIDDLHFNLGVKLLNDRFGIQTRGGCSCAGTYGHYLLNVTKEYSGSITGEISKGILTHKPGWIRMSIHPTTSTKEMEIILNGIIDLSKNFKEWGSDYTYNSSTNEFDYNKGEDTEINERVDSWFA